MCLSVINKLAKYTSNKLHIDPNLKLVTGGSMGTVIATSSFVRTFGLDTYYVNYWDNGNGIIQYDYNIVTNWQAVGSVLAGIVILAGITYLIVQSGGALAPALIPTIAGLFGR